MADQGIDHGDRDRNGYWMLTASGRQVWPLALRPEDIDIRDIAHSLSRINRFNGHFIGVPHYSVAEHSLLVAQQLPPALQGWGLMHDAAEAYFGDFIRPVKWGPGMETIRTALAHAQTLVYERFGLHGAEPAEVELADDRMLMTERDQILPKTPAPWTLGKTETALEELQPYDLRILGLRPQQAEFLFLEAFSALFIFERHL